MHVWIAFHSFCFEFLLHLLPCFPVCVPFAVSVLCRIVVRCLCGIHVVFVLFWIGFFVHVLSCHWSCCWSFHHVCCFLSIHIFFCSLIILRERLPRFSPKLLTFLLSLSLLATACHTSANADVSSTDPRFLQTGNCLTIGRFAAISNFNDASRTGIPVSTVASPLRTKKTQFSK